MIISVILVSALITVLMILPSALIIYTTNVILDLVSEVRLDFWPTTIAFAYLLSLILTTIGHIKAKKADEKKRPYAGKVINHE